MGERERNVADTQARGELGGYAVKLERRPSRRQIPYFKVLPADSVSPTRANGFHPSFLGCESGRIALEAVGLAIHVSDFGGSVNAIDEAASVAFNRALNTIHFGEIDASSNDHGSLKSITEGCSTAYWRAFMLLFQWYLGVHYKRYGAVIYKVDRHLGLKNAGFHRDVS